MHTNLLTLFALPLAVLCGLITACSPGQTPLENYAQRIERSLDIDSASDDYSPLSPPLPRNRKLMLSIEGASINLLEMWSLGDCALEITLGRSNSSLGKMASASQRLLLELQILSEIPACRDSLNPEDDAKLIATLDLAQRTKQQQLPARIWNATLGGPEFRSFWQQPSSLTDYPGNTGTAVPTALSRLTQITGAWLGGDYAQGHNELEALLGRIRSGDGGALLAALQQQQHILQALQPDLERRLTSPPLCFGGNASNEGRVLDTVVRKFFVGRVQPWSVLVDKRRRQLMPAVFELEEQLDAVRPQSYRLWQSERDALLQSARSTPRSHALALAALLESCGMRPGVAAANPG